MKVYQPEFVSLADLYKEVGEALKLWKIAGPDNFEKVKIKNPRISRPGLFLTGYEKNFKSTRIQLIGNVEFEYLLSLNESERCKRFCRLVEMDVPAIIFTKGNKPPECFIKCADKKTAVFITSLDTPLVQRTLYEVLSFKLAKYITIPGVMLNISGIGVLIIGPSGIGKSETALDLLYDGFSLIADDVVKVMEYPKGKLLGMHPKKEKFFQHLLYIKGVGPIDVMRMFGIRAVGTPTPLNLVIELKPWEKGDVSERTTFKREIVHYIEVPVEKRVVLVKPGRNIATIVKSMVYEYKLRLAGYDTFTLLDECLKNAGS